MAGKVPCSQHTQKCTWRRSAGLRTNLKTKWKIA